jgi:uncharacterized membrane protein
VGHTIAWSGELRWRLVRPSEPVVDIVESDMSWLFIVLQIGHIVAVVIAFGPLFVYPVMLHRTGLEALPGVVRAIRLVRARISEPAFLLVGLLGILTVTQHPDDDIFRRLWVELAIPLWLFAASVVWFVQRPLARRVAETVAAIEAGDEDLGPVLTRRLTWLTRVTLISWVGLIGMVWLMVVQPA